MNNSIIFVVPKYGERFYENFQFDLYDAIDWPLEWLFAISSSDATGIPSKLMGCHK